MNERRGVRASSTKSKVKREQNPWLFLNLPMLRMKCSVVEKPQWGRAVPNQALAADAGGGKQQQGEAIVTAK